MHLLYHCRSTSVFAFFMAAAPAVAAAAPQEPAKEYELTLHFIGRDGQPSDASHASATLYGDPQSSKGTPIEIDDKGNAVLRLAPGTYTLSSRQSVPLEGFDALGDKREGIAQTILVYPDLVLDEATSIDVDARKAKPVEIEPPQADAELFFMSFGWTIHKANNSVAINRYDKLFTGRLGPNGPVQDAQTVLGATWLAPGAPEDSPYQFNYAKFLDGQLTTGYREQTSLADYSCVKNNFAQGGSATPASFVALAKPAHGALVLSPWGKEAAIALPSTRREFYYKPSEVEWTANFHQLDDETNLGDMYHDVLPSDAGDECGEALWNQAVFGPGASNEAPPAVMVRTEDNHLLLAPNILVDSEGRLRGGFTFSEQHSSLFRDDALFEEANDTKLSVDVPPESAHYRAEVHVDRGPKAELSKQVDLEFTFVSEASEEPAQIPLTYIHFLPALDKQSAAPQGSTFELPIRIESHNPKITPSNKHLHVEVSYDDGDSWDEVPVSGSGLEWKAELEHPQHSGYVSLRGEIRGGNGTSSKVTIIRAYRLE